MLSLFITVFVFAFVVGIVLALLVPVLTFNSPGGLREKMEDAVKKGESAKREKAAKERIAKWRA
jgi:hypothetical protein